MLKVIYSVEHIHKSEPIIRENERLPEHSDGYEIYLDTEENKYYIDVSLQCGYDGMTIPLSDIYSELIMRGHVIDN